MEGGNLRVLLQNIRGKLSEEEAIFFEIEDDIDIVMLTETWMHDVEALPAIPGFEVSFGAARPRNAAAAGHGGVAIYFKQELFGKISIWKERIKEGMIWVRCQKTESAPVQFFCCCYIAPEKCPGCPSDVEGWFNTLEKDISEARRLGEVLVAGDFNAHIGAAPDYNRRDADGTETGVGVDSRVMEGDLMHTCQPRVSVDTKVTRRGTLLLDLCDVSGMRVVNGRVSGDIPAAVTSLGGGKCESTSVIDLFLACPRAFQRIQSLQVGGKLAPKADHLAVTLTMNKSANIDEVVQVGAASNNELLSTETPSFDAGQEFIMDPHLMPAFVEQLTTAAPLLEQICTTASTAAESRNADLLN